MINGSDEDQRIEVRYVVLHGMDPSGFKSTWEGILRESLQYSISNLTYSEDLSEFLKIQMDTIEVPSKKFLSRVSMLLSPDITSDTIPRFEKNILSMDHIYSIVKVFDSYKLKENKRFLEHLFEIEMKVREIYTILLYYLDKNIIEESEVKIVKEFRNNSEEYRRRLMNELFFIEFSDYKKVDRKRETKIKDILQALQNVNTCRDLHSAMLELNKSTLGLTGKFPRLLDLEKIIGRLEKSRNNIAHNRYLSEKDIENLKKASGMIDDIYNELLDHIFSP